MTLQGKPRGLSENNLNNFSPLDGRIGFWGTVSDVHPETNRVDILMDTGILLTGVPVGMSEYVKENKIGTNTFYSGKVNLPARESYVFCLMPNKSLTSAFVLCSGIPYGNSFSKKFFSGNETEKNNFPQIEKNTDQEGWTIIKKKDTGNLYIENVDQTIKIELCRATDNQDSQKTKGVRIDCFGAKITVGSDKKITLEGNSGKVEIP